MPSLAERTLTEGEHLVGPHPEDDGRASGVVPRARSRPARTATGRPTDPTHKQRSIYTLTAAAIELVPVLAMLGDWGSRRLPATAALSARARFLADGGPDLWERLMAELRAEHLGVEPDGDSTGVREQLARVYADAAATEAAPTGL